MRNLLVFIVFIFILGCSSTPSGYTSSEQVEALLLNKNKEYIIVKLGAPNEKLQVSDNIESWTYKSFAAGLTGGKCNVSITFVDDKVKTVIINAHDRSWISYPLGSCENLFKHL